MSKKLKNYYYKISMKTKWVCFITVVTVYLVTLLGVFGYRNYERIISNYFITSIEKYVNVETSAVSERLMSLENQIQSIQYDDYIYSFIQETTPDYIFQREVEKYLKSLMISRREFKLASIQFTNEPDLIYTVSEKNLFEIKQNFNENNIYDWADKQEGNTLYFLDNKDKLYIVQKIISKRDFKKEATVIFEVDLSPYIYGLSQQLGGLGQGICIIGENNVEILSKGIFPDEYKSMAAECLNDNLGSNIYLCVNHKNVFIVYDYMETENLQLGVAVLVVADVLFSDIRRFTSRIILISLATIPIFLLIGYQLYKDMIHPIYELASKMEEVDDGIVGVVLESDREDEIGTLFRSFNKMSNKIHYLMNKVYKEQIALKNSEIKLLQSQMDPHFLYNTLEVINWSARMDGADEVADMIEALAGMMEVNIDRKNERFLTIEDEIEYTKHYIFLIKKRFGENIEFSGHIDSDIRQYKVPRLILQPLVENAVEHGIGPVGKGVISLRIYKAKDILTIEVEDNGQGILEDDLSKIQSSLKEHANKSMNDGKIGVLNVHSRLQLIYDGHSGVEITSKYNKGTLVKIDIPIKMTRHLEET